MFFRFTLLYLDEDFILYILLSICWSSWSWSLVSFNNFGKLSVINFSTAASSAFLHSVSITTFYPIFHVSTFIPYCLSLSLWVTFLIYLSVHWFLLQQCWIYCLIVHWVLTYVCHWSSICSFSKYAWSFVKVSFSSFTIFNLLFKKYLLNPHFTFHVR